MKKIESPETLLLRARKYANAAMVAALISLVLVLIALIWEFVLIIITS